jgi:large subunit ribosomal protein L4
MFRAVFRELANPRAGTASTKRRDEVSGGGKKPWRQKGTGRARHGSTRSPQWRHGGVVFGPTPRSFEVSLNKKERKAAMRAALSERFRADAVTVLETDGLAVEKTRDVATLLFGSPKAAKSGPRTLVIYGHDEHVPIGERLTLLARNLPRVAVTHTGALDVKDVLRYARLVLTSTALAQVTAAFEQPDSGKAEA